MGIIFFILPGRSQPCPSWPVVQGDMERVQGNRILLHPSQCIEEYQYRVHVNCNGTLSVLVTSYTCSTYFFVLNISIWSWLKGFLDILSSKSGQKYVKDLWNLWYTERAFYIFEIKRLNFKLLEVSYLNWVQCRPCPGSELGRPDTCCRYLMI